MYLKQIEMRGFKSFADKTIVSFREGVTCVVGPNGSGKSNITDAVRWVLGEQRIKTLRGNKMEDVIFNGTKHRKSLGLAEVKLTFDNSNQFFPLEYDEITIVRKVHRSGESEYYINQMPCRLKDVRELFMDTGIGREGYSIIGQGRIDEILSNNKEERRLLFEEAAGIIKYKTRKIESEKKLKTTTENLTRIQDILSEIEDRVEPLRIESERAKQYVDLTDALKNIELNYYAKRYLECEQGLLEILEQMRTYEDQLKAIEIRHEELKVQYDLKDRQIYEFNRDIRTLEAQYHELLNYESKTIGDRELLLEKKANTQANLKRIQDELSEIEEQRAVVLRNAALIQEEQEVLADEFKASEEALAALVSQLNDAERRLSESKSLNENDRRGVIDKLNQIELKKQEIDTYERQSSLLGEKMSQLIRLIEQQQTIIDQSHTDKQSLIEKYDAANLSKDALNDKLGSAIQFLEHHKKQLKEEMLAYESIASKLSKVETEHKLLKTLEEEYDGYDKGVKDILMSLEDQSGIIGIVASLIEVPKQYEIAIEVALGRAIQNIVCEKISDAKRSIEFLRRNDLGRVTFLPLENLDEKGQQNEQMTQVSKEKGFIGVAKDLILVDPKFEMLAEFLLGRILVVEDFETASRLIRIKNLKYKVITLQGDVLVPGGAITGGSFRSKVSNILGRKRRIAELASEAVKLSSDKEAHQNAINQLQITLDEQENFIKSIRGEQDFLRLELVRLEHMRDNHDQMVEASRELYDKYVSDHSTLKREYDEAKAHILQNTEVIERLTREVEWVESTLSEAKARVDHIENEVRVLSEAHTSAVVKMNSTEQQIGFKSREAARIKDELENLLLKSRMREKQITDFTDHFDAFDDQAKLLSEKIITIKSDIEACKRDIDEKTDIKQKQYGQLDGMAKELADLKEKQDLAKEGTHKLDVKKVKLEVEKDTVTSELWEKYEMSMAEALQVEEVPYQKSEMKQLRQELKMLGTVNVGAIKEYEEVSTRFTFLTEQKHDLLEAIGHLEKIIADLEKKMVAMFKENFEIINNHFKGTFKALFNGGDAELILADYDDILDCDVEIIAQPPGKKLQSINLLSGGEKALTAIALLFAILSTKPTPFCILDEIEAALDDVNVYRFADFIKDYAKNSQFVVITHRKGTMEIADTLYGVTMEEYGISKVLSVRLEDIATQLGDV